MIPKAARDLINLHLDNARKTDLHEFAERSLHAAESMLAYALAASHLQPREHANEVVHISLIRAQRANRACAC